MADKRLAVAFVDVLSQREFTQFRNYDLAAFVEAGVELDDAGYEALAEILDAAETKVREDDAASPGG